MLSAILPLIHFCYNSHAFKTYFAQKMPKVGFLAGTGVYASILHVDEVLDKYENICDKVYEKLKI